MSVKDLNFSDRILIGGHSEGAIVAVSLINDLAKSKGDVFKKIKMVMLSGVPMEPFKKIVSAEVSKKEKEKFWSAYKRKDDKYLRSWGSVSYQYLTAAFAAKALSETLRELAVSAPKMNVQVFQGLNDENVSAKSRDKGLLELSTSYLSADLRFSS